MASKRPRVSVVMSVLAPDIDFLRIALESLLAQTLADFEVILLEDPSPIDATALIEELGDARIHHHRNAERTSLATSRARTLELASSELVAVMDADDRAHPERLERQCAFLDDHPEVDVLGAQIEVMDADGTTRGYRAYPTDHDAIVAAMRRFNPLAHPAVAMRKAAVEACGGYAELAGKTCDDYELWSRMAARGHRFANLPAALLRYRLHPQSHKARLLRQTLADTIWIKERYWRDQFDWRDRLRLAGERALRWLPPRIVENLFLRMTLRPHLEGREGA